MYRGTPGNFVHQNLEIEMIRSRREYAHRGQRARYVGAKFSYVTRARRPIRLKLLRENLLFGPIYQLRRTNAIFVTRFRTHPGEPRESPSL